MLMFIVCNKDKVTELNVLQNRHEHTHTHLILIDVTKQLVHSVRIFIKLFRHRCCIAKLWVLFVGVVHLL